LGSVHSVGVVTAGIVKRRRGEDLEGNDCSVIDASFRNLWGVTAENHIYLTLIGVWCEVWTVHVPNKSPEGYRFINSHHWNGQTPYTT